LPSPPRVYCRPRKPKSGGGIRDRHRRLCGAENTKREKLSGRQKSAEREKLSGMTQYTISDFESL
jgi:hypothetical protein